MVIEIIGVGTPQENMIRQVIKQASEGESQSVSIIKSWVIPDILSNFGIKHPPGIMIDNTLVWEGSVPNLDQARALIRGESEATEATKPVADNSDDWPSSLNEAVEALLQSVDDRTMGILKSATDGRLSMLHYALGQAIRNSFGLWAGNEALLNSCGTPHADDASMVILRAAAQKLQ